MLEKIAQILRDYKENQELVITEGTEFEALELDSLDFVELIMKMEDEFSVSIDDEAEIKTVGELMKIIQSAA
jgi:acyl carrier protein